MLSTEGRGIAVSSTTNISRAILLTSRWEPTRISAPIFIAILVLSEIPNATLPEAPHLQPELPRLP